MCFLRIGKKLLISQIQENISVQFFFSRFTDGPQPVNAEQPQQVVFVKPKVGSPKNFFSFREGLLEQAVVDCVNIILRPANDVDIIGTWLLTEYELYY